MLWICEDLLFFYFEGKGPWYHKFTFYVPDINLFYCEFVWFCALEAWGIHIWILSTICGLRVMTCLSARWQLCFAISGVMAVAFAFIHVFWSVFSHFASILLRISKNLDNISSKRVSELVYSQWRLQKYVLNVKFALRAFFDRNWISPLRNNVPLWTQKAMNGSCAQNAVTLFMFGVFFI